MEQSIKEKLDGLIQNLDEFWFLDTRQERMKKFPFRTLKMALERRILYLLIRMGMVPDVLKMKVFFSREREDLGTLEN